jgi:hypothetical protein
MAAAASGSERFSGALSYGISAAAKPFAANFVGETWRSAC